MNILKKWKKCISKDPMNDIKKLVQSRSKSEQKSIINGCYLELSEFNALQLVLLWGDPLVYKNVILELIDLGGSIDKLSSKGINFMHLFLMLFYFCPSFRSENVFKMFYQFLNYGLEPTHCMCQSTNVFTYVDLLVHLQNTDDKKIFKLFGNHPLKRQLLYSKLETHNYEEILLILLCYGVPYHTEHPLDSLTWFSCDSYLKKNNMFQLYAKEKMKLPLNLGYEETRKRIHYIVMHFHYLSKVIEKLNSEKTTPIGFQTENQLNNFYNINFYLNSQLQFYEFLPPIPENGQFYHFHKTFYFQLISNKSNPFTRTTVEEDSLKSIQNYFENNSVHIFPMTELNDLKENVYIFSEQKINDTLFKKRQSFHFIEQFFEIYHPYNQISRLDKLKKFEIKYISHVFYYETNVLKKFFHCLNTPTLTNLYKIMLYYCRKSNKYVSIMYFLMEEIFQDLACFYRLQPYISCLNNHYDSLFEQYIIRFEHFDTQYMNRFVENMLVIYRFKDSLKNLDG